MNNKGNLLTKKKYKIVNQKAGFGLSNLPITVKSLNTLNPDNKEEPIFQPFPITIQKYSGLTGLISKEQNWYNLIKNVNGKEKIEEFHIEEEPFITLLCSDDKDLSSDNKQKFESLDVNQEMRRCIAITIAFLECNPKHFLKLIDAALKILVEQYKKKYQYFQNSPKEIMRRSNPKLRSNESYYMDWLYYLKFFLNEKHEPKSSSKKLCK